MAAPSAARACRAVQRLQAAMGDQDARVRSAAIDAAKQAGPARSAAIEEAERAHRARVAEVERKKATAAAFEHHVAHLVHWSAATAAATEAGEEEESARARAYRLTTAEPVLTELLYGLLIRQPDNPVAFLRRYCQLLRDAQHAVTTGESTPKAQTQPQPQPEALAEAEMTPDRPQPASAAADANAQLYQPELAVARPPRSTLGRRSYFDELQHAKRMNSACVLRWPPPCGLRWPPLCGLRWPVAVAAAGGRGGRCQAGCREAARRAPHTRAVLTAGSVRGPRRWAERAKGRELCGHPQ